MRSRRASAFLYALVGALVGSLLAGLTPALAGIGDFLVLGNTNTANQRTTLKGSAASNLKIINDAADGRALDLRVQPGNPPLSVDSDIRVADLNADRVDSYHANDLVRVASSETGNASEPAGGVGVVRTAEIVAPGAGYILIDVSMDVKSVTSELIPVSCLVAVNGLPVWRSRRTVRLEGPGPGLGRDHDTCSTFSLYKVSFPGTIEAQLYVEHADSRVMGIVGAAVSAIYIPFGYNGSSPLFPVIERDE